MSSIMAEIVKMEKKRIRKQECTWNREETTKLITELEQHPHLWNENLEEYKNRKKRRNSLLQIGDAINKTPEDIWIKWQNLRGTFRTIQRKKQEHESGSNLNEVFNPKWAYFNRLLFLEKRQKLSTKLPKRKPKLNLEQKSSVTTKNETITTENEAVTTKNEKDFTIPTKKRRKKQNSVKTTDSQIEIIMKKASDILNSPADSCQIFGDFVAEKLRKLSERKRERLEIMIQQAILTVQLEPEEVTMRY